MDDGELLHPSDIAEQDFVSDAGINLSPQPETKSRISDGITLVEPSPFRLEYAGRPAERSELQFRHGSWAARRLKVFNSLVRLHKGDRRLERFANCGAGLHVAIRDDGNGYRWCSDKCRDRTCVACGRERAAIISENLASFMEPSECRFVVLTLRHSHAPLKDQIDRLYRSFGILRRRSYWKDHVKGGAAFCEIKKSEKDGLWHPHLHLIVTGSYMVQKTLSAEWLAVTGDSSYVYINRIEDHGKAARYVTKYVTKPLDSSIFDSEETLDEAISALHGVRLCLTWGDWRGKKLTEPPPDSHTWTSTVWPGQLWSQIKRGEPEAAARALKLVERFPPLAAYLDLLWKSPPS